MATLFAWAWLLHNRAKIFFTGNIFLGFIISLMTSDTYSNWGSLILHGAINPTGKEIDRGGYGRVFEVNYEGTLCAAKEIRTCSGTVIFNRR